MDSRLRIDFQSDFERGWIYMDAWKRKFCSWVSDFCMVNLCACPGWWAYYQIYLRWWSTLEWSDVFTLSIERAFTVYVGVVPEEALWPKVASRQKDQFKSECSLRIWGRDTYCRGPPHMGLRDYGGLRTRGRETEGLQAPGAIERRFKLLRTIRYSSVRQATTTGERPYPGPWQYD